MIESININDIYLSQIPDDCIISDVYPSERNIYINLPSNLNTKKERYWVWKVLEKAINNSFGLNIENIKFHESYGKWYCDDIYFSLSHTRGAVAVIVSNARCGVDIENLDEYRNKKANKYVSLSKKICTENEINKIKSPDDFITVWTKKESIFKSLESASTSLLEIDSENYLCKTFHLQLDAKYILSVCCNDPDKIRIFTT